MDRSDEGTGSGATLESRASNETERADSPLPPVDSRSDLSRAVEKLGGKIRIVGPGFFLGEIAAALEIQACTQSSKPDIAQFFDNGFDGCPGGGVSRAFDGVGLIGDFARIARGHPIDKDGPVEVPVAWVNPLDLVPFNESLFLKRRGSPLIHNLRRSSPGPVVRVSIIGTSRVECNRR